MSEFVWEKLEKITKNFQNNGPTETEVKAISGVQRKSEVCRNQVYYIRITYLKLRITN